MPAIIKHCEFMRFIEIEISGTLSGREIRMSTSRAISIAKKHGMNKYLIDSTDAERVESMVDLFLLPKQYEEAGIAHDARIALVLPKSFAARQYSKFYATVCFNRGWSVQLFETRHEAVRRLTSGIPSISRKNTQPACCA